MYREEPPERVAERMAERVEQIAKEMNALDAELGTWTARIPDGCPAPPQAQALMQRREELVAELRALADACSSVPEERPGPIARLLARFRSR